MASVAVVLPVYPIARFREMQNGIGVSASACGADEVLVHTNSWKFKTSDFIAQEYRPVRVRIVNESDQVVSISEKLIEASCPNMNALIDEWIYDKDTRTQIFLGGLNAAFYFSLIAWIVAGNNGIPVPDSIEAFIRFVFCWIGADILCPPSYWLYLRHANNNLHRTVLGALHFGPKVLQPHQTAEKIVLIPAVLKHPFSFKVANESGSDIVATFYIDIFN